MNLTLWPALETPFLLLGCLVQRPYEGVCLVLLCFVFILFGCFLLEDVLFKRGNGEEVDLGDKGGSGKQEVVEGG